MTNQSQEGLNHDVQCSIQTIQMTQHVKTSDQLNTAVAELGPAQPQLVLLLYPLGVRWGKSRLKTISAQQFSTIRTIETTWIHYQQHNTSIKLVADQPTLRLLELLSQLKTPCSDLT